MISKNLLIHTVTVKTITGKTSDRMPVYGEPVTLSNVWVDYTANKTDGAEGKTETDAGTLFFDCTNSTPSDFVPLENMVFIFEGRMFSVTSIKKCYGLSGNHYEVGLR